MDLGLRDDDSVTVELVGGYYDGDQLTVPAWHLRAGLCRAVPVSPSLLDPVAVESRPLLPQVVRYAWMGSVSDCGTYRLTIHG